MRNLVGAPQEPLQDLGVVGNRVRGRWSLEHQLPGPHCLVGPLADREFYVRFTTGRALLLLSLQTAVMGAWPDNTWGFHPGPLYENDA